jgi:MATE family multidrug resistance protein
MAGSLGALVLDAHIIALNMAAMSFQIPLGIAIGATTRVGNLLGAGHPRGAQRAAWVAMALGAAVMSVFAVLFVLLRDWLPRVYTPDVEVGAMAAAILPIAAAFQIFDGIQVVGCGVLRGMGRTVPAVVFNLVGYWLIGLPLGWWLGPGGGGGLEGIWWGLVLGLGVVAGSLVMWIRVRGPATLGARIEPAS